MRATIEAVSDWAAVAASDTCPIKKRETAAADLTRRLWSEREHAANDAEQFVQALHAVDLLVPGAADRRSDLTHELIAAEFSQTAPDEANVERLRVECEHVARFVGAGLFDAQSASNVVAKAVAGSLGQQLPPQRAGRPASAPDAQQAWVEEWARWACSSAEVDQISALVDAVMSSVWLGSPRRELVAIRLAVEAQPDAPYDTADLTALAAAHSESADFGLVLETWLTSFEVEPSEVWEIAVPHLHGDLPEPIRGAIAAWAKQATKMQKTDAVLPAIGVLPADRPHPGYLDAVDVAEADHRRLAEEIVSQCEGSRRWNSDLRANVLLTWRQLDVSDPKARTTFLREIAIRFIESGHSGALELLDYSDLLRRPPQDVRDELRVAFRSSASGKPREAAVRRMLDETGIEKQGLAEKAVSWFGRGR